MFSNEIRKLSCIFFSATALTKCINSYNCSCKILQFQTAKTHLLLVEVFAIHLFRRVVTPTKRTLGAFIGHSRVPFWTEPRKTRGKSSQIS